MKAVRIILGILLTIVIAGAVVVGESVNVLDEGIKVKNVNSVFENFSVKELVTSDEDGVAAYKAFSDGLQGVSEEITEEMAEKIINSDSFVNLYKDCTTQMIKYFRKTADARQSEEEIDALVSNAVSNLSVEGLKLDSAGKEAVKTVLSETVKGYLDKEYQKADKYRNFNIFGLEQFTAFGNGRIIALVAGFAAIILLIIVCWSFGRAMIIAGLTMITAAIPFVLIGIGKQSLIPIKTGHFIGILRSLFNEMNLPVMLWALVVIAVGFIFIIIGISARLSGSVEE